MTEQDNYLRRLVKAAESSLADGMSGAEVQALITKAHDDFIIETYRGLTANAETTALVALGGYGRKEMSPFSDIDILVLHQDIGEELLKTIVSGITYPLWNAGVETSGVARTIDECETAALIDVRSLSSMFDARFLFGNRRLFSAFESRMNRFTKKSALRNSYIKSKHNEYLLRLKRYGDSVFVGEPHLKESEGGLRCYHSALWIAHARYGARTLLELRDRGIIDAGSFKEWMDSLDMIWKVRAYLHVISGRKQDRLDFQSQELIAKKLGRSIEEFMRDYYKAASSIHKASERLIGTAVEGSKLNAIKNFISARKLESGIYLKNGAVHVSKKVICVSPLTVFRAWRQAHRLKVRLSEETRQCVKESLQKWQIDISTDKEITTVFREILKDPKGIENILFEMHETGVLFALIPEFQKIHYKVQVDGYHIYTIDIHSILLLKEISNLANGKYAELYPRFCTGFSEVRQPDVLILSALLHDIGKGSGTKEGHDQVGARTAHAIAERLGFSPDDVLKVEFLVRSHLLLPHLAFGRDINDTQLVENLAHSVRTVEMLRLLYILTFADIRSTSPEVWTNWKGELLTGLYSRTAKQLSGEGMTAERMEEELKKKKAQLSRLAGIEDEAKIAVWLKGMPFKYILHHKNEILLEHFRACESLAVGDVAVIHLPDEKRAYDNVSIIATDAPGLFAQICKAFSKLKMSILEVQLNTSESGKAVDIFKVVSTTGAKLSASFDWERFAETVKNYIQRPGEMKFEKETKNGTFVRRRRFGFTTDVVMDNDVSAYYTVIEIHAPDNVGLLYRVANWLYKNGYDISRAKATTTVGQALDTFYIRRTGGQKIDTVSELALIKSGLLEMITQG